jgi:hypothetical protein
MALALALGASCTVFNGKSYSLDASDGACCPSGSGTAVCQGFEEAIASPWEFSASSDASRPAPDDAHAHCGRRSLHVHSDAIPAGGDFSSMVAETRTFADPAFSAEVFARAWVFLPPAFQLGDGASSNFASLFEVTQGVDPFGGVAAQFSSSSLNIAYWPGTGHFQAGTHALMRDVWTCVEWHVRYGDGDGTSEIWVDDEPTPWVHFEGMRTKPSPAYSRFMAGIFFTGSPVAQPPLDLWLDDLVVDNKRIGCGK